jgi:hypothetical protein
MRKASELRGILDNKKWTEESSEIQEIEFLLDKAIKHGDDSVYLSDRRLKQSTVSLLESCGYIVEHGGRYNEINCHIKIPK